MARFVKLTDVFGHGPEWVNLDVVKAMTRKPAVDNDYQGRAPERTELWYGGFGDDREFVAVVETPEQIVALGDPEHACPNPDRCAYDEYLGRGDGSGDLSHRAFHAAVSEAEQHISPCQITERTGRLCQTCAHYEERLRA
jgi:hypothetical protein